MAKFGIFNTPKHQQFDYKPRFYDADKEERDARFGEYKGEANAGDLMKSRIRSGFKRRAPSSSSNSDTKKANKRLLAVFVLLIGVTYLILVKYMPAIIESIE